MLIKIFNFVNMLNEWDNFIQFFLFKEYEILFGLLGFNKILLQFIIYYIFIIIHNLISFYISYINKNIIIL